MIFFEKLKLSRFVRGTYNSAKEIYLYLKYYTFITSKVNGQKMVIFNVDGRLKHGGLADRFYGIICCYAMCKIRNVPFKINFIHPFLLYNILHPNIYNWKIDDNDICRNMLNVELRVELGSVYWYRYFNIKKETHFYSNFCILDKINNYYHTSFKYNELYNELFRPSKHLLSRIDLIKKTIGTANYTSVCFRFQALLGDFKEANYVELSEEDKTMLICKCIGKLKELLYTHTEILVTSDSIRFLNSISSLPHIHIVPGNVVHMDYIYNANDSIYEKSFVDLYMLGGGDKIINICGCGLRRSGFPIFAADCFDKPIEFIYIQ